MASGRQLLAREAGLRRLALIKRSILARSVVLAGVLAAVADAFPRQADREGFVRAKK